MHQGYYRIRNNAWQFRFGPLFIFYRSRTHLDTPTFAISIGELNMTWRRD
jgi:hypothetical protein